MNWKRFTMFMPITSSLSDIIATVICMFQIQITFISCALSRSFSSLYIPCLNWKKLNFKFFWVYYCPVVFLSAHLWNCNCFMTMIYVYIRMFKWNRNILWLISTISDWVLKWKIFLPLLMQETRRIFMIHFN